MDAAVLFFLSSGLFLGWSLGANDAANVFGTAVGTRMVRFATAAVICSVFVVLGAVISGGGAAHTLGKLGAVNALGGSFMAAFAAAFAV
ncbi:MAG: inorganic phosphate transporter, partial [Rhodospirillales bacterium]|nr:inorganic phosphate transporter [Rhodospirillales bacterium]